MLVTKPYNRGHAVRYAARYAYGQNPLFGDFRDLGGNCTNFVSQCLYAGSCQMNYRALYGWYYISLDDRTPSWSGVEFFYNFLIGNKGEGPYGRECAIEELEIGDVIQLSRVETGFYHTLLVVGFEENDPLVAAQTIDAYNRPLSTYTYDAARYIKIEGVRVDADIVPDGCFDALMEGKSPAAPAENP